MDTVKKREINPEINLMKITKVTKNARFSRIQIPTTVQKVLGIKETKKEGGEETYTMFTIRNGKLEIKFVDKLGRELYDKL